MPMLLNILRLSLDCEVVQMIQPHNRIGFITYYGKEHNPFRDVIWLSPGRSICDQVI